MTPTSALPPPPDRDDDELHRAFWRAAEAAVDVRDRYQFFVWLRLHLNHLVPHEMAVCLLPPQEAALRARVDLFNSIPIATGLRDEFTDPHSRWWRTLATRGAGNGGDAPARLVPLRELEQPGLATQLDDAGFRALLVHGSPGGDPRTGQAAFVFALREDGATVARRRALERHLDLCMPLLAHTARRVLGEVPETAAKPAARAREQGRPALTRRQLEIVAAVRDAKSNAQIGTMLGISAATVKNHLHTIMRKLDAGNRAQLVAEAMTRRLIA